MLLIQALHDMREKAVGVLLRRTRSRPRTPTRAKLPHVVIDLEASGTFTRPRASKQVRRLDKRLKLAGDGGLQCAQFVRVSLRQVPA